MTIREQLIERTLGLMEQLIGSVAVIMGVLETELAAAGSHWHPFPLVSRW